MRASPAVCSESRSPYIAARCVRARCSSAETLRPAPTSLAHALPCQTITAVVRVNQQRNGGKGMRGRRIVPPVALLIATLSIASLARGDGHQKPFKAKNEFGVAWTINVDGFPVVA